MSKWLIMHFMDKDVIEIYKLDFSNIKNPSVNAQHRYRVWCKRFDKKEEEVLEWLGIKWLVTEADSFKEAVDTYNRMGFEEDIPKERNENSLNRQTIIWRKLSEDDLPEPGKYVLVKFSNGKYDYFWQKWKEDMDPDKFKYPDLDEEPDTMFEPHKLYEVVEWTYLDE